jgi:hypothetical protein
MTTTDGTHDSDQQEFNILDRTDRSHIAMPHGNNAPTLHAKKDKYEWSSGGVPGRFELIPKNNLNVDKRYQRGQISAGKVLQIARTWDWALLAVISVVQRDDGTFWVFDGGHRVRASYYRNDVDLLPCMVHCFSDLSDEAKAFLGKNLLLTNVNAVDKYKAAVVAKDRLANKAEAMLQELGISVLTNATKPGQIKCVTLVMNMINRNPTLARECLIFCNTNSGDSPISSTVLRGLFTLCEHFACKDIDVLQAYASKLHRHSQAEMEVRIRQMKAELGSGGEKTEACAIMSLINKGCRTKRLEW